MQTKVLNYRVIVTSDKQTGTGKPGFTALCPTLGVADDGDIVEKVLANVKGAIQAFVDSLIEDKEPVPIDQPEHDIVTTTQISTSQRFQFTQWNGGPRQLSLSFSAGRRIAHIAQF